MDSTALLCNARALLTDLAVQKEAYLARVAVTLRDRTSGSRLSRGAGTCSSIWTSRPRVRHLRAGAGHPSCAVRGAPATASSPRCGSFGN